MPLTIQDRTSVLVEDHLKALAFTQTLLRQDDKKYYILGTVDELYELIDPEQSEKSVNEGNLEIATKVMTLCLFRLLSC